MLGGFLMLAGCGGGPKPDSDSAGDGDSAADTSPPPFECGVTVPEGLRLADSAQAFGGGAVVCPSGLTDGVLTTAAELDAFIVARETCSSMSLTEYSDPSDGVDWTTESAIAATMTRNEYGWRLGAVASEHTEGITRVDWCEFFPAGQYDEPGTYLVVYAIPNDWPTELESTVTVYNEEP